MSISTEEINLALEGAIDGGKAILEIYDQNFEVEVKSDDSPLTQADKNAHLEIVKRLEQTKYPILSEEGKHDDFEIRKNWEACWIVDPLDGTKEFIKRNGEFTVNIAYVENNKAVAGIIYVPVKKWLYVGIVGKGAWKLENIEEKVSFDQILDQGVSLPSQNAIPGKCRVVGSRSHLSEETKEYVEKLKEEFGEVEMVSMGSSLKICLVAEGQADIYPRFAPTMEWDTAAGHAIVSAAKKELIDYKTNEEMRYNREELLNNWFIVK